jgi:sulfite reductase (NADPH) hemoprotein beta-component
MLQMIIANRLRDGAVVFLAATEGWEPAIAAGTVIDNEADAARLMTLAKQHEGECQVIDPQLIEVEVEDGQPRPTAIREAIRAFGPTVRTDLTER